MSAAFQIFTLPSQQALDSSARVLAGARLYFYLTGTSTPTDAYADSDLTTPIANPLTADSGGVFAQFFLDPDVTYRIVLKNAAGSTMKTWDPANEDVLSADRIGRNLYPRTDAEISAAVTPVNYAYPPGNLLRYGVDITGATDNATQIANAIAAAVASGGTGYVYHPGGTIKHASPITVPNNVRIFGESRDYCTFEYTGDDSLSAWQNSNPADGGGAGNVHFQELYFLTAAGTTSTAAAIELNACGLAFYSVNRCKFYGGFKFGIIIDGCEVSEFTDNDIQVSGPSGSANIWIVNGSDRTVGQSVRFTNHIVIYRNNIRGGYGIVDDGGSNHYIDDNNIDSCIVHMILADVTGFRICGNELEIGITGGDATVRFQTIGQYSGSAKGVCLAGDIAENFFGADQPSGSASALKFTGADFHQGIEVTKNIFTGASGIASDIDVTKLANSLCGQNTSFLGAGLAHYSGVTVDSNGNTLLPPQNGFAGTHTPSVYGINDTRYPFVFAGGVNVTSSAGSMQLDSQKWQDFTVAVFNTAGTLQHAIYASAGNSVASGYADKVTGASTSLANTPTVGAGTGFTNGAGINANSLVLDVPAQTAGKINVTARIVSYDGNATRCNVFAKVNSRNVNGTTRDRIELVLTNDMTGAAVNIDTTLLPAGKSIFFQVAGFIA